MRLDPNDRTSILEFSFAKVGDTVEFITGYGTVYCSVYDCSEFFRCRECIFTGMSHRGTPLCTYMSGMIREAIQRGEIPDSVRKCYHYMLVPLEEVVE